MCKLKEIIKKRWNIPSPDSNYWKSSKYVNKDWNISQVPILFVFDKYFGDERLKAHLETQSKSQQQRI